ncbi:MAG: hypothetical protein AMS18_08580 [Gemmatimonas sp. SG8_17]|nr:MAG: hypothetical protein AMS18_08580 [Gemmatimonas sp. SG8_17]
MRARQTLPRGLSLLFTVVAAGVSCDSATEPPPLPVSLSVIPSAFTLRAPDSLRPAVIARDSAGRNLEGVTVAWISEDTMIATVSGDGMVTARGAGRTRIVVGTGSLLATADVRVETQYETLSRWCGVATNGTAHCWSLPEGLPFPVPIQERLAHVGSTAWFQGPDLDPTSRACAAGMSGALYCWKLAVSVVTDEGRVLRADALQQMPQSVDFAKVDVGWTHSCALDTEGDAYCWGTEPIGSNRWGQMGIGTTDLDEHPTPEAVLGGLKFRDIVAGNGYTCAVDTEGHAHCWGLAHDGQLGIGIDTLRVLPVRVETAASFVTLSAESSRVCGLTADAQVVCWGRRSPEAGQKPFVLPGDLRYRAVAVHGHNRACAITEEGKLMCWDLLEPPTEHPNTAHLRFQELAQNGYCGIAEDDLAYCWYHDSLPALPVQYQWH